ncbi:plasmid replication protein [Piscibacillus sp. B03]|uniref:plasmid replication protein n=1 Tax=Piscibacillus sp. B03 TaxID=3457430 RepID=UPI003FCCF26F
MEKLFEINRDMQALSNRSDVDISLKFGFVGLGMGGGSIAAACAGIKTNIQNLHYPYNALLINTNPKDFSKVNTSNSNIHQITLTGYEKGAGRDARVGERAFIDNKDKIQKAMKDYLNDRDFIWVVAGLGGGTGTGTIIETLKTLDEIGFGGNIGLIITLPTNNEGVLPISNALERVQIINKAIQARMLGATIIVDNQKLFTEYLEENPNAQAPEYLEFSNNFVANTLHGVNVITNSFEHQGGNFFDASEFERMLKTPGILSLSKVRFNASDLDVDNKASYVPKIENSINDGILSNGYNFNKTKHAAINVVTNPSTANRTFNMVFDNTLQNLLEKYAPFAQQKPLSEFVDKSSDRIDFYAMFAGLDFPKRVEELVELKKIYDERQEQQAQSDMSSVLDSLTFDNQDYDKPQGQSLSDVLSGSSSEKDTQGEQKKSKWDKLI